MREQWRLDEADHKWVSDQMRKAGVCEWVAMANKEYSCPQPRVGQQPR
jgi:hypothetical protein